MSSDPRYRSSGDKGSQAWPRWMIIVVPLLVVVVVAGLWWALIAPEESGAKEPTATPSVVAGMAPQGSPTIAEGGAGGALVTATPTSSTLPGLVPTATPLAATPTLAGELTDVFVEGDKVVVTGTEGAGLRIRVGAGTGYDRVKTVSEGTVLEIVGGPKEADGLTWYQVRDSANDTGWAAADYLQRQGIEAQSTATPSAGTQ